MARSRLAGRVAGTGPIERVDVFRGLEIVHTVSPYTPASFDGSAPLPHRAGPAHACGAAIGSRRGTATLELSAGRILDAATFAMENPEKGIVERTEHARATGVSNTTGDDDGIDVTLDAPADAATLRFRTPVIDLDVPLADLADGATRTCSGPAASICASSCAACRPATSRASCASS